jgi:uncharacterized protein (TIGR02594 family)
MEKPIWIQEADLHLGLAEIPGPKHNPTIKGWLDKLFAWWDDDETPWCGVFVAHCMQASGILLPKYWMRAKDWLNWGIKLDAPIYGCIVVFERVGGGHVGFVVGVDEDGNLLVHGGNQKNMVSIEPFKIGRVIGYRWPSGVPFFGAPLFTYSVNKPVSVNEE